MGFHVVIPARYASTRLPGKPLLAIGGVPMIQRVVERACASSADDVLVATDDERIAAVVADPRRPGTSIAVMTDVSLASGTDRVAAVAEKRLWSDETIVVNVQGDEPFISPRLIDQVAALLEGRPDCGIATLATPITGIEEFMDPNVVKVVTGCDGRALYFSRAPIPWARDGAPQGLVSQLTFDAARRHIGLYAYRVEVLRRITGLSPSPLERIEKLEQLRALQSHIGIGVANCIEPPGPGIDTAKDLEEARQRVGAAI